jgi:hypothetical protein
VTGIDHDDDQLETGSGCSRPSTSGRCPRSWPSSSPRPRGRRAWPSAVTVFGGFTPLIATWLTSTTGTPAAPAFYVMALAVVSFVVLLTVRRRNVQQPAAG